MSLSDLVQISHRVGSKVPFWVQGPGGNISFKETNRNPRTIWIKASGTRLDEMSEQYGVAAAELDKILLPLQQLDVSTQKLSKLEKLEAKYETLIKSSALSGANLGRPSMEIGFHALLSKKWVLHFHAIGAVLMSHVQKTQPEALEALFKTHNLTVDFIGPLRPGLVLSKELGNRPAVDVYILENHGLILQSDSTDILERWEQIESKFLKDHMGWTARAFHNADFEETLTLLPDPITGPFKVFFPDTAVYKNEILAILKQEATGEYSLPRYLALSYFKDRQRYRKELSLSEIWIATQVLFKLCPDLAELPEQISETVAHLPTEKFRKGKP